MGAGRPGHASSHPSAFCSRLPQSHSSHHARAPHPSRLLASDLFRDGRAGRAGRLLGGPDEGDVAEGGAGGWRRERGVERESAFFPWAPRTTQQPPCFLPHTHASARTPSLSHKSTQCSADSPPHRRGEGGQEGFDHFCFVVDGEKQGRRGKREWKGWASAGHTTSHFPSLEPRAHARTHTRPRTYHR